MPVATLLGLGAVAVLLAAVVAAFVRQPGSESSSRAAPPHVVRPSSAQPSTSSDTTPSAAATPSHGATGKHHHVGTHVLGQTVHRQGQALPYTGPAPVVPTSAVGLLAIIGGAWLIVRWPAAAPSTSYDAALLTGRSVTARSPRSDGAIERLRSPGHQFIRPSSAATDGTSSDLTSNVSSSKPAVTAKPVS